MPTSDAIGNSVVEGFVDAYSNSEVGRVNQTLSDINARRLAAGLTPLDQNDPELMNTVKGIANAGSERLTTDRIERYRDKLSLSGVDQGIADQAVDHLTKAFTPRGGVAAVPGDNLSAINAAILTGQNSAEHGTAFGLDIADTVMRKTGDLVQGFGGFIKDNPVAMYALEGIDFAAGPAVYVARKALTNLTPVGELLETAQSSVANKIAEKFTAVGYNDTDAMNGGVGGLTLMMAGATGIAGAAARLGTFLPSFRTSGLSKPGPVVPSYHANNFDAGKYVNRQVSGDEVFYKYHGIDNRLGRTHNYVTSTLYSSEAQLRSQLAILDEWGIEITHVTTFKPAAGTWISEGSAASQAAKFTSEVQPGGGFQGLIDVKNLPKSSVIRTDRLPSTWFGN